MTTAAVVGAGSGLGAAAAHRFDREGFDVASLARRQEHLGALAAELTAEASPHRATPQTSETPTR